MVNNAGVYIPSIDAKDIYLSSHYIPGKEGIQMGRRHSSDEL